MSVGRFLQQGAAGNAGGATYVDDVFSTYLYIGNSTERDIQNGLDLSGEGGLVWIKDRSSGAHTLSDTENGANKYLSSSSTAALTNSIYNEALKAFNSDGFKLPGYVSGDPNKINGTGYEYASWTFRKQPGFFDVVTYTGNGTAGTEIAHNLGSAPGMIIVKRTNSTSNWAVYHRSSNYLVLNSTAAAYSTAITAARFGDGTNVIAPTESVFTIGGDADTNQSGSTYVAYLFAHDAQEFGTDSDESIIKCGSFTASAGIVVDLGFEPQWVAVKASSGTGDWYMFDTMRGWGADQGSNDQWLIANTNGAEFSNTNSLGLTPTGFTSFSAAGATYIYVAIRRPHKPASEFAATDLHQTVASNGNPAPDLEANFGPIDAYLFKNSTSSGAFALTSRLTAERYLQTTSTASEVANTDYAFDFQTGCHRGGFGSSYYGWLFRRAPGFFDVVTYTGTGSQVTVPHNLGVVPQLILNKPRTSVALGGWYSLCTILSSGSQLVRLDSTAAASGEVNLFPTAPTAENYYVNSLASYSNANYISYLFATVPGISKVGSYSGTGSNVDVDCGFTSGARFVLVKRTDSTGDWYVWDSVRGIVAGNDPYLFLNTTAAQVTSTDYIDPLSSGFTITSSAPAALNASGGSYIFLAIA